jgi:hypothetical protein
MLRKCSKCQEEKNLEDFTKDKRNPSGRSYECYVCHRKRGQEYQKKMPDEVRKRKLASRDEYGKRNREKINEKNRERHSKNPEKQKEHARKYRESHRIEMVEYTRKWRKRNWEKVLAQSKLKDHVDRGNIIRPEKCSLCKSSDYRIEAHHPDYSKPLDVVWVCQKCHASIHQRIDEEKLRRERLNDQTSKEDAKVRPSDESGREKSEEVSPPIE